MAMVEAAYTERYCAYIDILGFSSLINELDRGNVEVAEIYRVLASVHARTSSGRPEVADLRSQSISDAVALSAAANGEGLEALCRAAEELSRRLLRQGYFARGAITKGRLYHGPDIVFGPALVQAYHLEIEVAKYPRIVLPRSIAAEGVAYSENGTHWKRYFDGRFIQASDGPFFLHVLRDLSLHVQQCARNKPSATNESDPKLTLLKMMRKSVQRRLDEASDNPNHFQKVAWFAAYWNQHIEFGIPGLEAVATRPL
jgi:hypothetical protein